MEGGGRVKYERLVVKLQTCGHNLKKILLVFYIGNPGLCYQIVKNASGWSGL